MLTINAATASTLTGTGGTVSYINTQTGMQMVDHIVDGMPSLTITTDGGIELSTQAIHAVKVTLENRILAENESRFFFNSAAGRERYGGWGLEYASDVTTSASSMQMHKYLNMCKTYYYQWDRFDHCYKERPAPTPKTPLERLKEILDQRKAPILILNKDRKQLAISADVREERARETLRRVIGDEKYFAFLKNGFISVRAKSGLNYQIFPAYGITCVYDRGIMVERLCVVLRGDFPPTDSLIMRYLMILNNENQFRGYAIKHSVFDRTPTTLSLPNMDKNLAEIFAEMKKVA